MWPSLLLLFIGGFVVLRARSVPDDGFEAAPNEKYWKNGYEYSTIPLRENMEHERRHGCDCSSKVRYLRRPKLRTVIRRNDAVLEDPEETMENFVEEFLLRLYLKKELLATTPVFSSRKISKGSSRTEKQVQSLPAFQHKSAVYSDEDNYRISHSNRFYSQEPVPGQLLYPPVSPKFHPVARVFTNSQGSNLSKPRYVSSMLIPHFLNKTIPTPTEIAYNILKINSTETDESKMAPKRVRFGKNSGYINTSNVKRKNNNTSDVLD